MAGKTDAYVDTSALIAFADRSDTYHSTFRSLRSLLRWSPLRWSWRKVTLGFFGDTIGRERSNSSP